MDSFGIKGFHDLWLGRGDSSEMGKLQDYATTTIVSGEMGNWEHAHIRNKPR
jgi:hypothetical protein